ncbi:ATP-binding protein, partial [Kitasatospora sp. NPDC058263]
AALRERVFEEGWTSKDAPAHRPRGLGLAMVRRLVERTGGRIVLDTGPLGGARFTVELPEALHDDPPAAVAPARPLPALPVPAPLVPVPPVPAPLVEAR